MFVLFFSQSLGQRLELDLVHEKEKGEDLDLVVITYPGLDQCVCFLVEYSGIIW